MAALVTAKTHEIMPIVSASIMTADNPVLCHGNVITIRLLRHGTHTHTHRGFSQLKSICIRRLLQALHLDVPTLGSLNSKCQLSRRGICYWFPRRMPWKTLHRRPFSPATRHSGGSQAVSFGGSPVVPGCELCDGSLWASCTFDKRNESSQSPERQEAL